jgi:hypothetical protein
MHFTIDVCKERAARGPLASANEEVNVRACGIAHRTPKASATLHVTTPPLFLHFTAFFTVNLRESLYFIFTIRVPFIKLSNGDSTLPLSVRNRGAQAKRYIENFYSLLSLHPLPLGEEL